MTKVIKNNVDTIAISVVLASFIGFLIYNVVVNGIINFL